MHLLRPDPAAQEFVLALETVFADGIEALRAGRTPRLLLALQALARDEGQGAAPQPTAGAPPEPAARPEPAAGPPEPAVLPPPPAPAPQPGIGGPPPPARTVDGVLAILKGFEDMHKGITTVEALHVVLPEDVASLETRFHFVAPWLHDTGLAGSAALHRLRIFCANVRSLKAAEAAAAAAAAVAAAGTAAAFPVAGAGPAAADAAAAARPAPAAAVAAPPAVPARPPAPLPPRAAPLCAGYTGAGAPCKFKASGGCEIGKGFCGHHCLGPCKAHPRPAAGGAGDASAAAAAAGDAPPPWVAETAVPLGGAGEVGGGIGHKRGRAAAAGGQGGGGAAAAAAGAAAGRAKLRAPAAGGAKRRLPAGGPAAKRRAAHADAFAADVERLDSDGEQPLAQPDAARGDSGEAAPAPPPAAAPEHAPVAAAPILPAQPVAPPPYPHAAVLIPPPAALFLPGGFAAPAQMGDAPAQIGVALIQPPCPVDLALTPAEFALAAPLRIVGRLSPAEARVVFISHSFPSTTQSVGLHAEQLLSPVALSSGRFAADGRGRGHGSADGQDWWVVQRRGAAAGLVVRHSPSVLSPRADGQRVRGPAGGEAGPAGATTRGRRTDGALLQQLPLDQAHGGRCVQLRRGEAVVAGRPARPVRRAALLPAPGSDHHWCGWLAGGLLLSPSLALRQALDPVPHPAPSQPRRVLRPGGRQGPERRAQLRAHVQRLPKRSRTARRRHLGVRLPGAGHSHPTPARHLQLRHVHAYVRVPPCACLCYVYHRFLTYEPFNSR